MLQTLIGENIFKLLNHARRKVNYKTITCKKGKSVWIGKTKHKYLKEAAKKSSSLNGRAIKRGRGGKGPAIKKRTFFAAPLRKNFYFLVARP